MDTRALLKHMAALGLTVPVMSMERTYSFGPWAPAPPPTLWGDAVRDEAVALQWYIDHGRQIPKGLYRSGTELKLRLVPVSMGTGRLELVGGPEGALIKFSPSAEFGQNSGLAAQATGIRKFVVLHREFQKTKEALCSLGPNAAPEDTAAVFQAAAKRQEVLQSLPPVDYSGLTPGQAREKLYRAIRRTD